MRKILVAGAGHGGITCAYNLAKEGYDVTVLERKKKEDLGYDWHDCLSEYAFKVPEIPEPKSEDIIHVKTRGFTNPSFTVKLKVPPETQTGYMMDRKVLINHLINEAEKVGVKFLFERDIKSAVTKGSMVLGLKYTENNEEKEELCDLVIDACGMYSPVRRNLPLSCNIKNDLSDREIFHVYRVYYENLTGELTDPEYTIDVFHGHKPGIDWAITDKEYVDILIGKFGARGELTDEEIEDSLNDYKKRLPFMGDKIIRGGCRADIPITKMLPMIICDGYAAIGDSAGMTFPLNGSGIILSMKAGKILADAVIEAKNRPYVKNTLWKYQYNYFQKLGKDFVIVDIIKNFFTTIESHHVDTFLEKEILDATLLSLGDEKDLSIPLSKILHIISSSVYLIDLFPSLIKHCKSIPLVSLVSKKMPKDYDKKAVEKWLKLYNAL